MNGIKLSKALWFSIGILSLGVAFLGVIVPGIPWSTPTVLAAICFAKSSDRMHAWIYNHHRFGPFLHNWQEKKIFPTKAKYLMLITMASSLLILWITTANVHAVGWMLLSMILVVIWGWRYPGSEEEHDRRLREGKRIAWLK